MEKTPHVFIDKELKDDKWVLTIQVLIMTSYDDNRDPSYEPLKEVVHEFPADQEPQIQYLDWT